MIDGIDADSGKTLALEAIDFAAFDLPVLVASEAEAEAHAALLAELDKASGGKTVWRSMVEVAAEVAVA